MTNQEQHDERAEYFNLRYRKAAEYWFQTDARTLLRDHDEEVSRKCRFCGRGSTEAGFRELAHAVPDFLGNLSIFSLNECDDCNAYFGRECEDDLSKATMLQRTLAGVPRKKSPRSTFKSNDGELRIDADGHAIHIQVPAPNSVDDLMVDGKLPESIPLLGDTRSQPYVPIRASMALVKIACSICPKEELAQCRGATEWVRGRQHATIGSFPVSYGYTPGAFDERVSHVTLLRRKDDGPEPYLWCVVQFRNFRYQVLVPFCPADAHWLGKADARQTRFEHYPSMFPPEWEKGPTRFHWLNWSGNEKLRSSWDVSHHVSEVIAVTRPPNA
jgi:hypothetical protein